MSPSSPLKKQKNTQPPTKLKRTFSHPITALKSLITSSYTRFVVMKALFYVVVTLFAATVVFIVVESMPGDPVLVMLARGNVPSGANLSELKATMEGWFGLNKPLLDRYTTFLGNFLSGNFGQSFAFFPASVGTIVLWYLPYTLFLAIPVLLISFFAGNRIGARAAYLKGKWNETGYFSLVFCNQLPAFWFAMVLLFLYTVFFRAIPPLGANSPGVLPDLSLSFIWDSFTHWCLPFLSLVVVYLGGWSTGMRSMVTHEMDADYVRYGKQLGFREKKLMSYTERNAILPQFTGLNLVFSGIIGNTMIIEIVFGWPGIGLLLFNAVNNLDYPLVFGCFFIIILIIVVGNFLIDILYGFLDPRIRTGQR